MGREYEEEAVPIASRFDNRMVWLPRVDRLLAGDILLTTGTASSEGKERKQSGAIRMVTGGHFSHALICSEPPAFVEALPGGASVLSLVNCFALERTNIRLLRYPDQGVAARAARLAQLEVGRDYSFSKAIRSVFPDATLRRVRDHGIFCSALVAQVFVDSGSQRFAATPVDRTTPATIEYLEGLADITDHVFVERLAPRNVETMVALDGSGPKRVSERQTELSARYARETMPLAEAITLRFPQAGLEIRPTYFGTLQFILNANKAAPSLAPAHLPAFLDDLRELDEALYRLISSGEYEALLAEIHALDDLTLQNCLAQSFAPDPDMDLEVLLAFYQTTVSQVETRTAACSEIERAAAGRSRSIGAYAAIEWGAIAHLETRRAVLVEVLTRLGRLPS